MKNHIWSCIQTVTLILHCKVGLKAEGIKATTGVPEFKYLYFDSLISGLHSSLSCLSCKNRCGSKEKITADPFDPRGACTCDESCVLFGNCCPDIVDVCPGINIKMTSFELLTRRPNTECYWQGMCHFEAMYLLINDCPFSERVCERTAEKAVTGVPVVDLDTHISYSNALCALCNGVTDIIPWDIKYSKFNISCAEECYKPHIWTQDLAENIKRFHPPRFLRPRQRCNDQFSQISECSSNWSDGKIRHACENGGISMVHINKENMSGLSEIRNYKNVFCAVCNFENIDKLNCGFSTNSMSCDGFSVVSLEKMFYVHSDIGMLSPVCQEGDAYIEEEKQCRKVHLFTGYDVQPFFEIRMSLHYEEETILPLHTANALINYVEDEFIHLNFFIGNSRRSWKQKLDFIQIGASKNNFTGDFIASAINISNVWADVKRQTKHGISLIISTFSGDCEYLNYSLLASTFDEQGNVNISGGPSRKPGEYHIINKTIYTCIEALETPWIYNAIIGWITIVSMVISIICIVIILLLKCVFPATGNNLFIILAFCLLISHIAFLIGPQIRSSYSACYAAGIIMHWAFLSIFAWMAAVAFDIYYYLVSRAENLKKTSEMSKSWKCILPFVFPTLFVVSCMVIEESPMPHPWKPSYGRKLCWLNSSNALLVYFVAPVAICVLLTAILATSSAAKLCYMTQDIPQAETNRFKTFIKLSVLTVFSWTSGFIAVPIQNVVLFSLFVILNASQGLFLLLAIWAPKLRKKYYSSNSSPNGTGNMAFRSGRSDDRTDFSTSSNIR